MAFLNPAALGSMPTQVLIGGHSTFMKACFDRTGTFDPSQTSPDGTTPGPANIEHPKQCNGPNGLKDRYTFIPTVAGAFRLDKRIGVALGIEAPYAARGMKWTSDTRNVAGFDRPGYIKAPPGVTTPDGLIASPARYMLVSDDVVVVYPTIAVGVKLLDWLQIGASFSSGYANIKFTNYTRFAVEGEDSGSDTPTRVRVIDWFVPRVAASIHAIPHDNLDIVAAYRYDDNIKAGGNTNAQSPLGPVRGKVKYTAPRPMWISFGIRYADRINPRAKLADATDKNGATDDPMVNERFDIELDVIYERNSKVTDHLFATGDLGVFTDPGVMDPTLVIPAFANPVTVPHNWKDQISVRLGGDYNVLPGQLAIRAGGSYETQGFRDGFGYIDYFPMQRFGAHVGLSGRFGAVELTLGYAHFFMTPFNNPNGQHPQVVIGLDGPIPAATTVINSGRYTAHFDVLTWGLRVVLD